MTVPFGQHRRTVHVQRDDLIHTFAREAVVTRAWGDPLSPSMAVFEFRIANGDYYYVKCCNAPCNKYVFIQGTVDHNNAKGARITCEFCGQQVVVRPFTTYKATDLVRYICSNYASTFDPGAGGVQ